MILSSFVLLLAAPAAQTAPAAGDPPKKPKVVCRSVQLTGSRLGGKRTCMTAMDWDRNERDARAIAQETQDTQIRVPLDN